MRSYTLKYYLLLAIFIVGIYPTTSQNSGSFNSPGQSSYEFEKLSSENGVSQSITYAIQQDSVGNIWIASEEGLIKYNSDQSTIYNKSNGLPEQVGNRVTTVYIDSKDRIWIGTESGLCEYDPRTDTFVLIKSEYNQNPTLIKKITEDGNGNIWVAAYNGLWKFNPEHSEYFSGHYANKLVLQTLVADGDKVYLGSMTGLFLFNSHTDTMKAIEIKGENLNITSLYPDTGKLLIGTKNNGLYVRYDDADSLVNIPITKNVKEQFPLNDIVVDNNGQVYIATDGAGIYYLDKNFKIIDNFQHNENNINSLSSNGVYDILIDKENILWVATYGGGVNYLDKNKSVFKKIRHILNNKNSIANNFSRAIEKDKFGNIWFGTKKGVSIWNPEHGDWKHLDAIDDIVMALEADDDNMWVGTYNNGAYKVNISNFSSTHFSTDTPYKIGVKKIYSIFKDSQDNIWLGGIQGELTEIKNKGLIVIYPLTEIKCITQTSAGDILVAGRNGVSRKTYSNGNFEQIEQLTPKNNIRYFTVNAMAESPDHNLLLSTNGGGIIIYEPEKDTLCVINMKSGLPSDIVQAVLPYDDNDLWASTTRGLVNIKLSKTDTIINVFDKSDGLASTEYNYGSYAALNKNEFIFGGIDGLTLFNPSEVKIKNIQPKVVFQNFSLFNKKLEPGEGPLKFHINTMDEIDLRYSENSLALSFLGVLQSAPSKIKYTWKLEGFDDDWVNPTIANQVYYTNLGPGDYIFKVKAANRNGEWSPVRSIKINVSPPWWATKWAYILYFLLVLAILYFTIYLTQILVNKKNAEEQIHFFNNLTHEIRTPLTILLSSLDTVSKNQDEAATKQVKKTIKRLNSLFEQMLNFQKATTNKDLIDTIKKINIIKFIDDTINNFRPLLDEKSLELEIINNWKKEIFYYNKESLSKILYNLITNAIKYTPENGKIMVDITEAANENLILKITDTGIGIPRDQQKFILTRYYRARNVINSQLPGTGLGLLMVKKLLEKYDGSISFESKENHGTTFTILLKNQEKNYKKSVVLNPENQSVLSISDQTNIEEYSNSKILIVEDNNELRELLARSLGTYFQVFEAASGKEGLKKAGEIFPDIILTDLIMPEMDGMEMSKAINGDINLNHIPIFMMSVLNNYDQKLESIESGISEYIEKPIDINLLLAKITNALTWQEKLRKKYIHDSEKDNATKFRNERDQEFVSKLETILVQNISNSAYSVHDLCENIGMSRTSLYMKLKNLIDLSPQDFIIHTRLKFAKKMLVEGNANIKEVAYESGFSNPKYFSTSFKKFYGVSPSTFLESLKDAI